jgi:hypothetical protein
MSSVPSDNFTWKLDAPPGCKLAALVGERVGG